MAERDAFGPEDESVQSVNLELDDTDLDALFGDMTSDPMSGDEQTVLDRQGVATSREAADLADLFGSVPTGTEYDGEASGQTHAGWLNLDGGSELLSGGVGFDEGLGEFVLEQCGGCFRQRLDKFGSG